ncbi:MAG: fatty acid--CoA ligase family protein [Luteolibacter sp.]
MIARSGSVDFFVQILRAWRDGQAVIPVEKDASEPILKSAIPEGAALVKYTPGATGVPRGIFLNDGQVAADGDRLAEAMELKPEVPNIAVISLAHSYGFSNVVLPLVLHGVPVHLVAVPFPRAVEEAFRCHESVVLPAVPSMWRAWHRAGILVNAPIRLALSAGAPLALSLEAEVYAASGLKIRNFYGASECGGISLDGSDKPRETMTSVGTVLPGVEVVISKSGRMQVASSSVAVGYDEHRADDLLGNGVYLTRDRGHFDGNGTLYLTGTVGGAINVAGRKVSPAKVEAAILETGLVAQVHVHGVPSSDPERFEEIAADYVLRDGRTLEELKSALVERVQLWEMPRVWRRADGSV